MINYRYKSLTIIVILSYTRVTAKKQICVKSKDYEQCKIYHVFIVLLCNHFQMYHIVLYDISSKSNVVSK